MLTSILRNSPVAHLAGRMGGPGSYVKVATVVVGLFLAGCGASSTGTVGDFSGAGAQDAGPALPAVGALDPSVTLQPRFASAASGRTYYKVGPTDVLKVSVFQVDELNRTVQVSGRGTITLPLIGEVRAAGRSAQEIETDIAARLRARYLTSPQVTVYIEEYNSQKITVSGAVKKPGVFPVKGELSLLQAIASAEGLDAIADPSNVVVFREENGTRYVGRFSVDQIRTGGAQDPLLQNGDIVMVDASGLRTALRDWSPALSGIGSTAAFVGVLK